ncbi:hypothetical protein HDU79_004239 [Rhizoclosmatium sp. JEL0117]|nr:hypothetical protein HDU79_004239 [Rhizoclosmatium sp. JEL0117]
MSTHRAALCPGKGSPLEIVDRPTPVPGPNQVVVESKALAVNPVDYIMRDGFQVGSWPVVLGSDVAGIVSAVGNQVTNVKVGDRVLAYAQAFAMKGKPDFGAFQEQVLVPSHLVVPIPGDLTFTDAATLPLAVYTTATGYFVQLGVPRAGYSPADKKAVIVWGAGGSIGTVAVQVAKILGFTVYATASKTHHEYLKSLGAHKCFDYKDAGVVDDIVNTVKADGFVLDMGYLATGDVSLIVETLGKFGVKGAKVASAPFSFKMLWWKVYNWGGVGVEFVDQPAKDADSFYEFVYSNWLKDLLKNRRLVASPKVEIVSGGLSGLESALGKLKMGVSGIKLVVHF